MTPNTHLLPKDPPFIQASRDQRGRPRTIGATTLLGFDLGSELTLNSISKMRPRLFAILSFFLWPTTTCVGAFLLRPRGAPWKTSSKADLDLHLASQPDGEDAKVLPVHVATEQQWSPRTARIQLPLAVLSGSFCLLGTGEPAHAGVGTLVPFEETRKAKFRGSLANSVVLLRLRSSLRKKGYFAKKAVVACAKPADELSYLLSNDFGEGLPPVLISPPSSDSIQAYIEKDLKGKKALVVFGKDVSISREGEVGETVGTDLSKTEDMLKTAFCSAGVEAVLLGGTIIHRVKDGGKDAGEDCFYPSSILSLKDGVATDIFAEVFGDLETPRQSVVLR